MPAIVRPMLWCLTGASMIVVALSACVGDDPATVPNPSDDASPATDSSVDAPVTPGPDAADDGAAPCAPDKTRCGSDGCVDLTTNPKHCGACGKGCGVGVCEASACPARLVFVTTASFTGALGGIAGADAKCQAAATAAERPGTYKAWLRTPSSSPKDRFETSPKPYKLTNNTVIASSWGDLIDLTILAPINRTEFNAAIPITSSGRVWTQTAADGSPHGTLAAACDGFTTTTGATCYAGNIVDTSNDWTEGVDFACNLQGHLFCFEQK